MTPNPNAGEDPWQAKTPLYVTFPIVEGGVTVFCDCMVKADMVEMANTDVTVCSQRSFHCWGFSKT